MIKARHTNPVFFFPFRLIVFYVLALNVWRLFFIWFNEAPDHFYPMIAALRLDFSMICGVFLFGFFPWLLYLISGYAWMKKLNQIMHALLWLVISISELASVIIYKEWGTTLDGRAIAYISHPHEAWASTKDFVPLWILFLFLLVTISGIKILVRFMDDWQPVRSRYGQAVVWVVLFLVCGVLGLRGGWQKLPIVPSDAFYSSDMRNNFAAVNKTWYLIYSLTKKTDVRLFNSDAQITAYEQKYREKKCSDLPEEFSWKDKNVVYLVAEGWSADMVAYLGGKERVTPFIDSLSEHSLRFTNIFSTGFRTDQGLMSLMSGVPSIGSINMPNVLDKVRHYPALPAKMKQAGWNTAFVYGGDLNFSNLYNYLTVMGFDTIISDKDYSRSDNITEWGVPDHIMLNKAIEVLDAEQGKFFATVLLLSSHAPFDVPWKNVFSGEQEIAGKYKESVQYSDQSLRQFFNMAKNKPWFSNTIFIFTSDHGSTHSGFAGMEDHNRFLIPFLVYSPDGQSTVYKGERTEPGNHFDLPATTTALAGVPSDDFIFGRNLFCDDKNRKAYWNTDVAAGCYGIQEQVISNTSDSKTESFLFLDMVKKWFVGI